MKQLLASFASAVLFALGLGLSGMTNPNNVLAFLDIAGHWNPSLALVMVGAIGVYAVGFRLVHRLPHPVLSPEWLLPSRKEVDLSLVVGASLFGVGWGLAGICPGPALVGLGLGKVEILMFVGFAVLGVGLHKSLVRRARGVKS